MLKHQIVRGRLAPSPTGALHLGNARSFLLAWLSVRSQGGVVVLRMEDLDHPKVKPATADAVLEDLRWLGLDWDEGPDVGGDWGPYVQHLRRDHYLHALKRLQSLALVYPCICSRKDVEVAQQAPHAGEYQHYPGICRERFASFAEAQSHLPIGRIPAWRFCTPEGTVGFADGFVGQQSANVMQRDGDFVLARDLDGAGYMLAVVVDDAAMQITEVLRGDDLLPATHRQLMLYEALGLPVPEFFHVPLVIGPDGRRLAKRHGDTRLSAYRELGVEPERIVGFLAWSCGLVPFGTLCRPCDLVKCFFLQHVPKEPLVLTQDLAARAGVSIPSL